MFSFFNLQEYPLPPIILQQILAKMDKESLVKLYLTSKLGKAMVEQLQGAKFERYVTAKREEIETLKVLKLEEPLTREGLVKLLHRKESFGGLLEELHDVIPHLWAPLFDKQRRDMKLLQKMLDNWDLLH